VLTTPRNDIATKTEFNRRPIQYLPEALIRRHELLVGVKIRTKDYLQIRDLINKEAAAVFDKERSELRVKAKAQILWLQNENVRGIHEAMAD